jgi:hypothetical protein
MQRASDAPALHSHIAPEPIEAPYPEPKVVRGHDLIEHRARIAAYHTVAEMGEAAPSWGTVCGIIETYLDSVRDQHGDRQYAREQSSKVEGK